MKQTCTWVRFAFFVAWSVAVCSLVTDVVFSAHGGPLPLETTRGGDS